MRVTISVLMVTNLMIVVGVLIIVMEVFMLVMGVFMDLMRVLMVVMGVLMNLLDLAGMFEYVIPFLCEGHPDREKHGAWLRRGRRI